MTRSLLCRTGSLVWLALPLWLSVAQATQHGESAHLSSFFAGRSRGTANISIDLTRLNLKKR